MIPNVQKSDTHLLTFFLNNTFSFDYKKINNF